MNLHEYQSKRLFERHGIPVPRALVANAPEQAAQAALALGGGRWVVKAQVHAGGRGKAGGVVLVDSPERAAAEAVRLLGSRLYTRQTGPGGLPVETLLIEETTAIARELYVEALVAR